MNGQAMNYKRYYESLQEMSGPVLPENLPKIKIDFSGMLHYAKSKGKSVPELSDTEKAKFVEGGAEALKKISEYKDSTRSEDSAYCLAAK